MINTPTGRDFFLEARLLVGTPWVNHGRSTNGMDCGGLLICVSRNIGIIPADRDWIFQTDESYRGLHETLSEFADELQEGEPREEGDILTYAFSGDMVAHCSIFSPSENIIIHAYPALGCVCEHSLSGKWKRKIHRTYRMRGLSSG